MDLQIDPVVSLTITLTEPDLTLLSFELLIGAMILFHGYFVLRHEVFKEMRFNVPSFFAITSRPFQPAARPTRF